MDSHQKKFFTATLWTSVSASVLTFGAASALAYNVFLKPPIQKQIETCIKEHTTTEATNWTEMKNIQKDISCSLNELNTRISRIEGRLNANVH